MAFHTKHTKMKRNILLFIGICLALSSAACGKKQIFEEENAIYKQVYLTDQELKNNKYYVKDGTKFIETYSTENKSSVNIAESSAESMTKKEVIWLRRDYPLIPSYYENELLAYPSESISMDDVTVERYKDVGYSIGIYGATYNKETGCIEFSIGKNVVVNSSFYNAVAGGKSDSIQIASINDEAVDENSINTYGIFTGLEKNKTYKIGCYAGTYYASIDVKADEFFLQSFESYQLDRAELTQNGYLSIQMPADAKSGYYTVNDSGLFKYYNYKKGTKNDDQQDMNEEYYHDAESQMDVYSQQYVATVKEKTNYVSFQVDYEPGEYDESEIKGVLTAPDGQTYVLTNNFADHCLTVQLKEAVAGRWIINIFPKDMIVTNISVNSAKNKDEAKKEVKSFTISDPDENVKFYAAYKGEGTIWGVIENDNNESFDMIIPDDEKQLYYTFPYLPSGTYTVTIYHYADTSVEEIDYEHDELNEQKEIITIEE